MEFSVAEKLVIDTVVSCLDEAVSVDGDTELLGGKALLDSMKLVEVCLALEDLADDNDFEFDWSSDATMSNSRSMFRTVKTLAEEFMTQANNQK